MLLQAQKAGVAKIVATPHFYMHKDTVDAFLDRRSAAMKILGNYLAKNSSLNIEIVPAAEVALERNLLSADLKKLTIGNTDAILIEMPQVGRWYSWMIDMLYEIEAKFSLSVILAHIDRYPKENAEMILDHGFTVQINAESLVNGSFFERKRLRSLCRSGLVHLIGSDAHDVDQRSYRELITASRKLPASMLSSFERNAMDILQ